MQAGSHTVSVNLQVPVGTKASGLQQLLAAANGVDVSNDVTIKVKTGTTGLSCFKNLGQLLLTWHSLTNHVSLSLLELAAVHAASRLSGLQLHLVQAAWQAVLLHSSQHSELLGIDSLIMKCGICGSQIMVLILARDTTHWAVRVLSSSSVPAHLPIIHKLA